MKVLLAGASGLVGRYLTERLAHEHDVLPLTRRELDITDRAAVTRVASTTNPSLLINCAAVQVDESEQNPAKARAVNVEGPRFLAEAANRLGAEIVHFGTQYAFEGEPMGRAPYTIEDETRPINVYGKTKVAGEQAVIDA